MIHPERYGGSGADSVFNVYFSYANGKVTEHSLTYEFGFVPGTGYVHKYAHGSGSYYKYSHGEEVFVARGEPGLDEYGEINGQRVSGDALESWVNSLGTFVATQNRQAPTLRQAYELIR